MAEPATRTPTALSQTRSVQRQSPGRLPGQVNVGNIERGLSLLGGGVLVLYGLRHALGPLALVAGGWALVYRSLSGHCALYQALGLSSAQNTAAGVTLDATVTVNKPVAEVYRFWRHLENQPRFMKHLASVRSNGKRSHWVARTPLRTSIEWPAEIVEERENAVLSWHSLPGADIDQSSTVYFRELSQGRGTEVHLYLAYAHPARSANGALTTLLHSLTKQQLHEDLQRFKQLIETGETSRSTP